MKSAIYWSERAKELSSTVLRDTLFYSVNNKYEGVGYTIGLASQVDERWRVGIAYEPKTKLEADEKYSEYIMPSKARFGFLFQPRNPFRTNFHADFEIINYSEINKSFDDGYAFYVGMEHYVGRAVPFRLGFNHKTAKQDKSVALPTVSIGTGFNIVDNFHLDIAAEYGKREYVAVDMFPDTFYDYEELWVNYRYINLSERGWENPDKVSESFMKIFTSVTYKF
jgi:long-subunit fatty acid transport protein